MLFLLPSLAGEGIFVVLPFLEVVRRSFLTVMTKEFCGMNNYRTIFRNGAFLLATGNTVRFAAVGIFLLLTLSLLLALMIDGSPRARGWKAVFLFPMAIPTGAEVLIWKLMFARYGLLNGLLMRIGRSPVDWLDGDASFWCLIISYLRKNMGYTIVLWTVGFHGIPNERREAAQMDGATKGQCFFRVILPELTPMLYTITILSFLNSFKIYREAYLVAGAYPQRRIYLLWHLFHNWFTNSEMDKMAAAGVCITVVFLLGVMLLQWLWDGERE